MSQDRVGNAVVTNNPKISVDDDTSDFSVIALFGVYFLPLFSFPNIQPPTYVRTNETTKDKHNQIVLLDYPLCGRHMKNQLFYKCCFIWSCEAK